MNSRELFKNITILTVTHNSEGVISEFLKSIHVKFKLFVVDNESKDKTRCILKNHRQDSKKLVFNEKGLGFGRAANIGLKNIKTNYVLLINPDAKIDTKSISKLYEKAKIYANAAILAPLHRNFGGCVHVPVRPFFFNKQNDLLTLDNFYGDCSVEYLSGAVMLLDRKKIEKIGYFDDKIFLYYDDDDLCIKSRKHGFENILVSNVIVDHFAGGSIGPPTFQNQWEKFFHMSFSRCYIEKKYFGIFKSLKISLSILIKSFIKLLGHILVLQFGKTLKDMASFTGALFYMLKIK